MCLLTSSTHNQTLRYSVTVGSLFMDIVLCLSCYMRMIHFPIRKRERTHIIIRMAQHCCSNEIQSQKSFLDKRGIFGFAMHCLILSKTDPFVRKKTQHCMAMSTTAYVVFCFLMGKCIIFRFNHRRNKAFHENIPKLFDMLSAFIVY